MVLGGLYRKLGLRYYQHGSKERVDYLKKAKLIYSQAVELEPDNIQLLHKYKYSLKGEERISVLKRIIALDNKNVRAYESLAGALRDKDPQKALQYAQKAYELAGPHEKKDVGRHLLFYMGNHLTPAEYIKFNLQYRNDRSIAGNLGRPESKKLRITLKLKDNGEAYTRDEPFNVVFTNISDKPVKLLNHQKISQSYFRFDGYPEMVSDFRFYVPYNKDFSFDPGDKPKFVELQPNEEFVIETNFDDVFSDSWGLDERDGKNDKGYIIVLQYFGLVMNGYVDTDQSIYSNAVHMKLEY